MTRAKPNGAERPGAKTGPGGLDARRFPALVGFFRGYLHQDVLEEHGTAETAARAFRRETSAGEMAELAAEWEAFARATAALPLAEVRRVMVEEMGSAWAPVSRRDLVELGKALFWA